MTNVVFICPVVNGHNGKGATSTNAAGTRNPIGKHEKSNPMTNRPVLESGMTISHLARKKSASHPKSAPSILANVAHPNVKQHVTVHTNVPPEYSWNAAIQKTSKQPMVCNFCNKINGTFNQSQSGSNGTLAPDEISKVQQSPESSTAHAD